MKILVTGGDKMKSVMAKMFWLSILWFKEAFKGFFRNIGWNVAALILSMFCLLGFAVSFIAGENAKYFSAELGEKIEIQVDLKDDIIDYPVVEQKIKALSQVKEVVFVSKDDAYDIMKEEMGEDADILEVLDRNPFPARFIVRLADPKNVEEVASEIKGWEVAENVQYGEGYVEKLLMLTEWISKIGYIVTAAVALATTYIVSSVIKFNIEQRRDEIDIKKLTGSGMFTIRFPFILEALIITGVSSMVVYLSFYFFYDDLMHYIKEMIPYIPIIEPNYIIDSILTWLLALSLFIGILGSTFSTNKYLKKY